MQDQLFSQEVYDRDMAKIAESLTELLDNAIYFQNYESMPSLSLIHI